MDEFKDLLNEIIVSNEDIIILEFVNEAKRFEKMVDFDFIKPIFAGILGGIFLICLI